MIRIADDHPIRALLAHGLDVLGQEASDVERAHAYFQLLYADQQGLDEDTLDLITGMQLRLWWTLRTVTISADFKWERTEPRQRHPIENEVDEFLAPPAGTAHVYCGTVRGRLPAILDLGLCTASVRPPPVRHGRPGPIRLRGNWRASAIDAVAAHLSLPGRRSKPSRQPAIVRVVAETRYLTGSSRRSVRDEIFAQGTLPAAHAQAWLLGQSSIWPQWRPLAELVTTDGPETRPLVQRSDPTPPHR